MKLNSVILPLGENVSKEIPSKVAQWAENIGIDLNRDFKRLLWPLSTRTLYPKASERLFNSKNSYIFWKILVGYLHIIEESSNHYQGVIKSQSNLIKRWMSQLKSSIKLPKSLDLNQHGSTVPYCSYSDDIGRTTNAAKKI